MTSKVLVLGDFISDEYTFTKASRLCPEAPAPVLLEEGPTVISDGGAGLVAAQLKALLGPDNVRECYGSYSTKKRIFADRQLVCRIDKDSTTVRSGEDYWHEVASYLANDNCNVVVVADYGKGAMQSQVLGKGGSSVRVAKKVVENARVVFVDSKSDLEPYVGAYAVFPNAKEHLNLEAISMIRHVVRKLGPEGCQVDGDYVPTRQQQVYDVTGAGDIFLAAFVAQWFCEKDIMTILGQLTEHQTLIKCARLANDVAGVSVKYLGTHVVTKEEISKDRGEPGWDQLCHKESLQQ